MTALLPLHANEACAARGVDDDGQIIVGRSWVPAVNGKRNAVVWEYDPNTGNWPIRQLQDLHNNRQSMAYDISGDADIIVGKSDLAQGAARIDEAVYWRRLTPGCTSLHWGPTMQLRPSKALAVSDYVETHERIIVGECGETGAGRATRAFRYTLSDRNFEPLTNPPQGTPHESKARDVSGDGSVIVGDFRFTANPNDDQAFVWFESHPNSTIPQRTMVNLTWVLTILGHPPPSDWTLRQAHGVSSDGWDIVGWGVNPQNQEEGWIANVRP